MENKKLKIFISLSFLLSALVSFSQVQDGGAIQARDNVGVRGQIKRNNYNLSVYDSSVLKKLTDGINVAATISSPVAITNANLDVALSTLAKESGGNLASINAKTPALGQALAAASVPVVLTAIQQAALTPPAAITNYANETGGNLAGINTKFPAQGQALAAASVPVVLTAIQQAALTPPAAITGFALETGHLSAIDTKTPALGQALAAAAVPVVLTAIQQAALTPPAAITNFANETGGNLAAIKADADKIPSQGQALAAASTPVVLTAIQQAALTPPAAITGFTLEGGHAANIDTKTPALGQGTKANSQPIVTASDEIVQQITGQAAQTATVNNIIPGTVSANATDVGQYRSFSIQINSTGTGGTFIFEGSNDNVNFVAVPVQDITTLNNAPLVTAITPTSSNKIYIGACQFSFLRVRIVTTITGGSIQAFSAFSRNPISSTLTTISQSSAGNLNVSAVIGTTAAYGDGTGAPTTGIVRGAPLLFNGTNLDRVHGNWNTTTGDAGAKTVTFNGATQTNFDSRGAMITVLCGTVSGTLPTLSVQLQYSYDAGTNWLSVGGASGNVTATGNTILIQVYPTNFTGAAAAPVALTTGATATVQLNTVLPRTWRLVYTIGGTTPSFAITAVYINYQL